ncbi:oxidoreductase [Frondihabitans cladoniiphilus]|uniref:SDR family NAD(P)-dependent oxidoreductase n=1 Tax=Frondihabitans cladoniiphilus TaxID=715785 RepID=A0ABP8W7U4_9MICO
MPNWTADQIPDQTGKTAIVTGANSGLGYETAAALAAHGARVVLAVRDQVKGRQAADKIVKATPGAVVELQPLDLASLASIRKAAAELNQKFEHIDLLVNNAGLMFPPKTVTEDGFELQFGTNHLGHFALTGLLLDNLLATPNSRVVVVSSYGHKMNASIHFDDLEWERKYSAAGAYGQSKLANLLFAYELERRLEKARTSTIVTAGHPGNANTDLQRHLNPVVAPIISRMSQSAAMGALPMLRAATDPTAKGGQYYGPKGFLELSGYPVVTKSSKQSYDEKLQAHLWSVSEDLTGVTFPV